MVVLLTRPHPPLCRRRPQSDAYAKRNEFILWALDVRKTDVENLGKFEERDLFKDYMEDYNTGTFRTTYATSIYLTVCS